ncbi:MAG: hypothetical protein QW567_02470 [Candidatus Hadarchaeales archaeon]
MRRACLAVMMASLLMLVFGNPASAAQADNCGVAPENGPWSSTFEFFLVYRDNSGALPEAGYPLIYLDNVGFRMSENDELDTDASDGKVYIFRWTPGAENMGDHSFYFLVVDNLGREVRYPREGAVSGPAVLKAQASIRSGVSRTKVSLGDKVDISGMALDAADNTPIGGASLTLCRVKYENGSQADVPVMELVSEQDGGFSAELEVSEQGISCYRIKLEDDLRYESTVSDIVYVSSLDDGALILSYVGIFGAVLVLLSLLLTAGLARTFSIGISAVGSLVGFFLMYLGAGELGVLAAGAVSGYVSARRIREWGRQLRLGLVAGLILTFLVGCIIVYFLTLPPDVLRFNYSVTQGEVYSSLFQWSLYSAFLFAVLAGLGAVLGGLLRKILKPGERESSQVAGKDAAG